MRRLVILLLLISMSFQSAWAMVDLCVELPGAVVAQQGPAADAASAADELHEKNGYCNCCNCCVACHGGSVVPTSWAGDFDGPLMPTAAIRSHTDPLHSNSYLERPERPKWLPA
ncbi:hypothetical protein [Pseudoduganella namucuonensis]|uniref:DUF2946 domain-containing protein n=1 Tax=Pseudoduganella namucuonensis TaxID=1035707 RepID=A0A1I7HN61_9BURK|nr:hypothetical protein [Pseudoduganella namucuonensis]SFU62177.1 hypothetical protein SAMN05216552_100664 [Pseudoduganella namucuonensis]